MPKQARLYRPLPLGARRLPHLAADTSSSRDRRSACLGQRTAKTAELSISRTSKRVSASCLQRPS